MQFSLNFHQTFAPEKEAIAQLVQLASKTNDYLSKEEISAITTIPTGQRSGKVEPNIMYCQAMRLISVHKKGVAYSIRLTPLGEVIVREDPFFTETLTHWLCHYNLCTLKSPATMWSYIFNTLIPSAGLELEQQFLENALCKHFNVSNINTTPLRTCYTTEKSFGNLGILEIEKQKCIFRQHQPNRVFRYLYAYLLISEWEELFPNQTELTYDHIKKELGFGKPFIWDDFVIMDILDTLQEERIVLINRQLSPITIVKQVSSEMLLGKIYSFLI
ncbi:hypothetical protein JV16_01868 [Anoxybacillus ayderensis]|uniref:DUF4007 domain-containing protein n=1 Tax=Anoxybacillus ayderensis TaxID=265546 RepID=A0A0D0GYR7_9BACL|nr:DUF4007 family protein [Anoxybacillus ayderensis]KIP20966.1 hypothetical protein JV16_01868 [Anoxybacillus ayderensis]